VISPETRMMGLRYGEEIMIVGRTMWTQSTSVTDGQTDRIMIPMTVQRRASHGKNFGSAGLSTRLTRLQPRAPDFSKAPDAVIVTVH